MTLKVTTLTEREIVMTRTFDAPRTLVFDALTKPDLLKNWLGVVGGWSLAVCTIDLRAGGAYRFVWRHADGKQMGMSGVYREVVPPERYAGTESFDDPWYPGQALGTTVLIEQGGRTTVSRTIWYESKAIRDGVLRTSMEHGVAASYDKLADLLASM
jgi:uncharacterized protein YndB with AHSA1/START domain